MAKRLPDPSTPAPPAPVARAEFVVTFTTLPDPEDLKGIVEDLQKIGDVERAVLTVLGPSEMDLAGDAR